LRQTSVLIQPSQFCLQTIKTIFNPLCLFLKSAICLSTEISGLVISLVCPRYGTFLSRPLLITYSIWLIMKWFKSITDSTEFPIVPSKYLEVKFSLRRKTSWQTILKGQRPLWMTGDDKLVFAEIVKRVFLIEIMMSHVTIFNSRVPIENEFNHR